MASCAPCAGTQYEPDDVHPCGHDPPGPGDFGTGNGSASADASPAISATAISSTMQASVKTPRRSSDLAVVNSVSGAMMFRRVVARL
jgi:hypothetical protein